VPAEYLHGRALAKNVVDEKSGEVLFECNTEIRRRCWPSWRRPASRHRDDVHQRARLRSVHLHTLRQDTTRNELEALVEIYRMMRPGEPPTKESAENLFQNLFFSRTATTCPPWAA
jgi:DNA-directed RNA polymerase subunit beta